MEPGYLTIKNTAHGIYKIKGSKFLGFAYPVVNQMRVAELLENLREEYQDASHHCYACRINTDPEYIKSNDDGEPSYSAGVPILNTIKAFSITNVLVVVIRYFGGIKLGVSGLKKAYGEASKVTLDNATIIKKELIVLLQIFYEYPHTRIVEKVINSFEGIVIDRQFAQQCTILVSFKERMLPLLLEKLSELKLRKLIVSYEQH